jgi:hypothetical protein
MQLEVYKYYYIRSEAIGLAGIFAKPTPELLNLQRNLVVALAPFTLDTGTIAAFTAAHDNPTIDAQMITYVSTLVPIHTSNHFSPHVTTSIAPREYLDKMLAERFRAFSISHEGAAFYQLGPFGTTVKTLKEF